MSLNNQDKYRYRLLSLLGHSAVGEVYLAEDIHLGRQVALKVIRSDFHAHFDPQAVNKALLLFHQETQVLARFNHPHILPLFDYGQVIINGTLAISFVMPLCLEGSLATWLRQRGNPPVLSLHEVDSLLSQIAHPLQQAHNQHIFHLHIKPENVLIQSRKDSHLPDLFLADFGMAALVATISNVRQQALGSCISMAPEQWEGYPVAATDQYALAVMIYQLLAGHPPYLGSQEHLVYQHMHVHPQPPSYFNPQIPTAIDAIVLRALAKEPEDRFDSIFTFAHTFHQALYGTVPPSHSTAQSSGQLAAAVPAFQPKSTHHTSRKRVVAIGLCILALLILVSAIGSSIIQPHSSTGTAPRTSSVGETATAQVATATTRMANPNPYPPYTGTLIFYDPMTSDRFNWTTGNTNDAACTYTGGAYHVIGKESASASPCLGSGILFSNYSNFVFEVHMTMISGTGGGIRFHISSMGSYNFVVYQNGHYELTTDDSYGTYHATLLSATARSSIKTGLKQTNSIAVVASGKQIDLYINHVRIGGAQGSFPNVGSFGLIAEQGSEVAYSTARLWTW